MLEHPSSPLKTGLLPPKMKGSGDPTPNSPPFSGDFILAVRFLRECYFPTYKIHVIPVYLYRDSMIESPLTFPIFCRFVFSPTNGWRFPIRFRSNAVALEGQRCQPLEIVPFLVQLHLWHLDEGRWWAAEEDAFWRWGEICLMWKKVADL